MDVGDHVLSGPDYPPLADQVESAAAAAGRALAAGVTSQPVLVDKAEQLRRLAVCGACPNLDINRGRCTVCGCVVRYKTRLATEHCPLDPPRW
jgi:hypothetical protein